MASLEHLLKLTRYSNLLKPSCLISKSYTRAMSTAASQSKEGWINKDTRRMLNAVYKVKDLNKSIEYYKKHFGLKLHSTQNDKSISQAFLSYSDELKNFGLFIIQDDNITNDFNIGEGFGHFGIAVKDIYKTCDNIKESGGKVTREAGPVKGGKTNIAFVEDPSGYKWELIERKEMSETADSLCQVMLRVGDLDRSIKYYTEVIGMKLLRIRDNEKYKYKLGFVGYGPEDEVAVLELTYNYGQHEYNHGNTYEYVTISTKDIEKTCEQVKMDSGKIISGPDFIRENNMKTFGTIDPDGWHILFVEDKD